MYMSYQVMIGLCKFVNKAHTVHIWFREPATESGITWLNIWKFFILFIARSTWILSEGISCVAMTSPGECWPFVPTKGGGSIRTPTTGAEIFRRLRLRRVPQQISDQVILGFHMMSDSIPYMGVRHVGVPLCAYSNESPVLQKFHSCR